MVRLVDVAPQLRESIPHWQYQLSDGSSSKALLTTLLLAGLAVAQQHVSFQLRTEASSTRISTEKRRAASVLAPRSRFNKESWEKQRWRWLRPDFVYGHRLPRRGQSRDPNRSPSDEASSTTFWPRTLTSTRPARKTVSVIGASFGGAAAADASIEAEPGELIG